MNEQWTYLGYVLFEAPREYVLHGPLQSINWLRLCPHLGGPGLKPCRPEEVVIVLMTAAHISPNVFSLWKFLSNIQGLFLTVQAISFTPLYITFIRTFTSFILNVLFTYSLLWIFVAGWLPLAPCVRQEPHTTTNPIQLTRFIHIICCHKLLKCCLKRKAISDLGPETTALPQHQQIGPLHHEAAICKV